MEQYQQVNGIILRSRDYKEADQLLTVYTREQGKLTVQARGVKKTTSKLRSGILLFSHTDLVLTAGKGFPIVTGAATVTAFASLRSDFARMSYASYGAELLDQVLVEGQPDEQLFLLILQIAAFAGIYRSVAGSALSGTAAVGAAGLWDGVAPLSALRCAVTGRAVSGFAGGLAVQSLQLSGTDGAGAAAGGLNSAAGL